MDKKIILVLTANPKGTSRLRLDEEVRNIEEALRRAQQRDAFELMTKFAVTPRSLLQSLSDTKPKIVHFCGHSTKAGLMLEDAQGKSQIVSTEALSETFYILASSGIECVILNACYSEVQAQEIVKHIPYVIGMSDEIGDRGAIAFSESFYDALGSGQGYEKAFELGRNRLTLESNNDNELLKLKTQVQRHKIPTIWLQGWGTCDQNDAGDAPDELLDWTDHYSKEPFKIPSPEQWEQQMFPELAALKSSLANTYSGKTLDLRSKLSLPAALAVGYTFPETAGYVLQIETRQNPWRSDAPPADCHLEMKLSRGEKGPNLLVGIGITGSCQAALETMADSDDYNFDAVVYLEPEKGPGSRAIASAAEAVAYSMDAKDLLRSQKQKYEATSIHLVLLAPAGFALFLGHWLSRLGEVVPYEWSDPNYLSAFRFKAV